MLRIKYFAAEGILKTLFWLCRCRRTTTLLSNVLFVFDIFCLDWYFWNLFEIRLYEKQLEIIFDSARIYSNDRSKRNYFFSILLQQQKRTTVVKTICLRSRRGGSSLIFHNVKREKGHLLKIHLLEKTARHCSSRWQKYMHLLENQKSMPYMSCQANAFFRPKCATARIATARQNHWKMSTAWI